MVKPVVISLFSGAGGLDYGLEAAGFRTAVTVEMNRDCCETLRRARDARPRQRDWSIISADILGVPPESILAPTGKAAGDVDLVVGGPPCQPFSQAGFWNTGGSLRLNDPRAETLQKYFDVIAHVRPRVFVLENVRGLLSRRHDDAKELFERRIADINATAKTSYRLHYLVLNAADFGAPQERVRVFVIASRNGLPFDLVPPSNRETRTTWDALGDEPPPAHEEEELSVQGSWAGLLPSIPEGENYLFHTDRGMGRPLFGWRTKYWSFLLKLAKDRPSHTLSAQPGPAIGPFHWDNRRLSRRELCRLMTFPEDVEIFGSRSSAQRQLGNGVVSLMAEVLGREIRHQLLGGPAPRGLPKLLPARRGEPPPPGPVLPVPRRYRNLEGDHAPHPGTGKGPGALRRLAAARAYVSSEECGAQ